jgi:hypothetical protein
MSLLPTLSAKPSMVAWNVESELRYTLATLSLMAFFTTLDSVRKALL